MSEQSFNSDYPLSAAEPSERSIDLGRVGEPRSTRFFTGIPEKANVSEPQMYPQTPSPNPYHYQAPEPSDIPEPITTLEPASGGICCKMTQLLACVARSVIVGCNALTIIVSIVLFLAGVLFFTKVLEHDVQLKSVGKTTKVKEYEITREKDPKTDPYTQLTMSAGSIFMFMGCCCCCIGYCGYYLACASRCLLKTYVIILNCVFVLLLWLTISIYANPPFGKETMKKSLANYKGIEDTSNDSISWDILMVKLQCCGVDGYQDFQNLKHWPNKTIAIPDQITPLACCKSSLDFSTRNYECTTKNGSNDQNNNMNTGCFDFLFDSTFRNAETIAYFVFFHLAMITQLIFGWWIIASDESVAFSRFDARQWSKAQLDKRKRLAMKRRRSEMKRDVDIIRTF